MSAVADRILERLARIPMNGIGLRMEIGCEVSVLDKELRTLEEGRQIRRVNGKYHVMPAAPAAAQENSVSPKNEEKVCTGPCGESKPLDQFYDRSNRCKRCTLDAQKALKAVRPKSGGGGTLAQKIGAGETRKGHRRENSRGRGARGHSHRAWLSVGAAAQDGGRLDFHALPRGSVIRAAR